MHVFDFSKDAIDKDKIVDKFAIFANVDISNITKKCDAEDIAYDEFELSDIDAFFNTPCKYTLILVNTIDDRVKTFMDMLIRQNMACICIYQTESQIKDTTSKRRYIYAETEDAFINAAIRWIAEQYNLAKKYKCANDCQYSALCSEAFFCAKKFILGIAGGKRCVRNIAHIYASRADNCYYLTFYKKYKTLKRIVTHWGQVLLDKKKDGDCSFYENAPVQTLEKIGMKAWVRKTSWTSWLSCQDEKSNLLTEGANGKQLINFSISLKSLGLGINDEYEVLYTYKIPYEFWGSYLRRTFSCFRETIQVDFQTDVDVALEALDFEVKWVDDNASEEQYIDLPSDDTSGIRHDTDKSILWQVLGEAFIKDNIPHITSPNALSTSITTLNLNDECSKIIVSWDSSVIFPDDAITKGRTPSPIAAG